MYFSVFESACAAVHFSDDNLDHEFEKLTMMARGRGIFGCGKLFNHLKS
jgi:hypothetical protein